MFDWTHGSIDDEAWDIHYSALFCAFKWLVWNFKLGTGCSYSCSKNGNTEFDQNSAYKRYVLCIVLFIYILHFLVWLSSHGCLPNGALTAHVVWTLIDSAAVVGHGRAGAIP